ncbi:AMP-binding protein [Singulisphaera acidiphila]|uniref:Acyl-CoA synthetase (AMP-forming)/AMP-acid ligase II n=1 Tax=Singulisphaera acidiphila (strain ATCC BAA-1392 / DSM 18658 / VKM B-2454 / MOB10) TaxID=886293 RepID=L0DN17_SINAD|nr:AMP-binding protein [Singulisphaera acidiphila]AGA30220.1 acyl-CoA synthetase (AMP-forming)/AMP-acid ligase II [Singulisphaera acidiphila DSM 18658]
MASLKAPSTPWVFDLTVGLALRRTAALYPERDAVVFPSLGIRWSWSEFDRRVDSVASGLLAQGVERGEHVGIWSMNAPEWVVAQFAVGRIGAILVNINPAYRLHELEETLAMADVATLIVGSSFKDSNFVRMVETICPEVARADSTGWASAKLPCLRRLISLGEQPGPAWLSWIDLETDVAHEELNARERSARAKDVYNIQFTSGTTGLPKGAMLTHRNVLMNAFYIGERVRYGPDDRVCVPVPFYHCFGCVLGTLVCALTGSALVVPAPSFDPGLTLAAIDSERCTSIYGVPTMFVAELGHPDRPRFNLSSLRTGIMAGSPCPLPLMEAVVTTMGASQMTIGYGQTEASPIITQTSVDDPIEVRVGTVGRPIPGVEVQLVDPVTRKEVGEGETGELRVRGHGVMAGYYKAPEATAQVIDAAGWLYTGDLAMRRADGNYRIVGRCKELIIRGGENIYPPEIEEFLHHHPAVAEVAVVGLPDVKYGEVIAAWVVPQPGATLTEEELRHYCRGQIAHFKVPHYIRIVSQLPKTVTGKIRKVDLRAEGITHYGLETTETIPTA